MKETIETMCLLHVKREFLDYPDYLNTIENIREKLDTGIKSESDYSQNILHALSWYRLYLYIKN